METYRIEKLRRRMDEQGIGAVVVTSADNRYYFSNFRGSSGALLITAQHCFLFTDFRYVSQAKEQATKFEVVQHAQNMLALICEYVKKFSVGRLGLELDALPTNDYLMIHGALQGVELVDVQTEFFDIRMVKDPEELDCIRRGVGMCDQAFAHILTFIRPGMAESEVGLELEFFMRRTGAEGIKANHVIVSGERSALPHGQATNRILGAGEFLTMDIGARVNGYYSDFTRTVAIGEPSEKQREIYEIVRTAQQAALDAIGPGQVCSELDEIARGIIRNAGYGENFGHSLGHSIGLAVHEKPGMRATDATILQPGMVITVEPGIYISGFGGVRIEDLIVITDSGYENFTHATKELQIVSA